MIRGARLAVCVAVAILGGVGCDAAGPYVPRDGDIVFHTSRSRRSDAIQRATRSPFNHMGVVFLRDGRPYVLEAHDGVESTPFEAWVARGKDGHYVVKRLRNAEALLTPSARERMQAEGRRLFGRPYDPAFGWSDDRLYCSELVWKIFERGTGVRISEPRPLRDYDLQDQAVVEELAKQFGDAVPLDTPMVAPGDMFASKALVSVR